MAAAVDWDFQWNQIVARAWTDDAFKKRLLASPAEVLKEYGLVAPSGIKIKIHENTEKLLNLVVPIKPAAEELSEEELHRVAGGYHHCHGCGGERCGYCGGERCGCGGERCGGCGYCGRERCRC